MKIPSPILFACFIFLVAFQSMAAGEINGGNKLLFTVQRKYAIPKGDEKVTVVLDWKEVIKRFPEVANQTFLLKDLNFGKTVIVRLIDLDKDDKADKLAFDFIFTSTEPVYAFAVVSSDGSKVNITSGTCPEDKRLQVTYLTSYTQWLETGKTISDWPAKIVESTMRFYPDPAMITLYAPGQWNYEYGFFLNATFILWRQTKKEEYFQYIKRWADRFIDEEGNMDTEQYRVEEFRLDDILPGRLFISLYEVTKDEKYRRAASQLADHLLHQPKTKEGGYWHKQIYPYQMWLDGIYMGDIFSVHYAEVFDQPALFDEAAHQIKLIARHTTDPVTGLMYHGWDESKNKVWAHPEKGTSPEFWGRAIGWYIMALVECLDYIPVDHPERKDILNILKDLSESVANYQDKESALWYQVIDKGNKPGNWIETSCSAMFAFAFAKGYHKGYLGRDYYDRAAKAFDALTRNYVYFDDEGKLYLAQTVKVGTLNPKVSKGDFDYYITTERRINDYKGLAALLYASLEIR